MKVQGLKMIRYRCNLNPKLCQLKIGGRCCVVAFSTFWEIKVSGLWGEYGCKTQT